MLSRRFLLALLLLSALLVLSSSAWSPTAAQEPEGESYEVTGSFSLKINNTQSQRHRDSNSTSITLAEVDGYNPEYMEVTITSVAVRRHLYLGFDGGSQTTSTSVGPGDQRQIVANRITAGHELIAHYALIYWWAGGAGDNASWGPPSTIYANIRAANSSDWPDTAILASRSFEFHDSTSIKYYKADYSDAFLNVSGRDFWVCTNGTFLNGTGPNNCDTLYRLAYSGTYTDAVCYWYYGTGWLTLGDNVYHPCYLVATRADPDGSVWDPPNAEALGMSANYSGRVASCSGDEAHTIIRGMSPGIKTLEISANLSCDVEGNYVIHYARAKDRSHAAESVPTGRWPSHLFNTSYVKPFWEPESYWWQYRHELAIITVSLLIVVVVLGYIRTYKKRYPSTRFVVAFGATLTYILVAPIFLHPAVYYFGMCAIVGADVAFSETIEWVKVRKSLKKTWLSLHPKAWKAIVFGVGLMMGILSFLAFFGQNALVPMAEAHKQLFWWLSIPPLIEPTPITPTLYEFYVTFGWFIFSVGSIGAIGGTYLLLRHRDADKWKKAAAVGIGVALAMYFLLAPWVLGPLWWFFGLLGMISASVAAIIKLAAVRSRRPALGRFAKYRYSMLFGVAFFLTVFLMMSFSIVLTRALFGAVDAIFWWLRWPL